MKDSSYLLWAAVALSICILISLIPITEDISYNAKELYYVDVPYSSPVYETVYHKDPIYEALSIDVPLYDTVNHRDPVYETLYNIELRDESVWGDDVYKKSNVYDIKKDYSGTDTWGNSEYTFTLYYYSTIPDGSMTYRTYYQIDDWSKDSYQAIVSYDEWSEEVISGYDTQYEEVICGYDYWNEEVVDRYETLYESEVRTRYVRKSKPVTKTLYQWLDIQVNDKTVTVK